MNKVNLKLKVTDLRSCGHHDQSPSYLAFYRAADSELTLGEIGRYRHQRQGVGYIYKVGLQTEKNGSAYGNTKLMFFTVHCMAKESYMGCYTKMKRK